MIGNINENMDCGTTNAEAYPKKEIDNQIYYRPREMGVIYNTAGDTKVNISVMRSNACPQKAMIDVLKWGASS